ncbi:hypothetical protein D0U04_24140 [Bacillus clarus]|uniref:Uncharacterized protein n=1 Tax=Bacillus clarus TaxID=2338372 RepID=A0A090YTB7_9BACI|nr:hypothetical protein [Bacillus clarus]KFN01502.1 hypothetical protein DJ93_3074 [Bacillus clarus]RFT63859.1 hypothetical protein D0U04_24140 [Bacillus clarus]
MYTIRTVWQREENNQFGLLSRTMRQFHSGLVGLIAMVLFTAAGLCISFEILWETWKRKREKMWRYKKREGGGRG